MKAELSHLSVTEFVVDGEFEGASLHSHDNHTDSFYVLEGEVEFTVEDRTLRAGPGTLVAVPPGVEHAFSHPWPGHARFLNIHAPDAGFADHLRRISD